MQDFATVVFREGYADSYKNPEISSFKTQSQNWKN